VNKRVHKHLTVTTQTRADDKSMLLNTNLPFLRNHFTYLFLYLDKSYRSLIALILPVIFTYFVIFST